MFVYYKLHQIRRYKRKQNSLMESYQMEGRIVCNLIYTAVEEDMTQEINILSSSNIRCQNQLIVLMTVTRVCALRIIVQGE